MLAQVDSANTYFGCIVGRVANRIEGAQFSSADCVCNLEANDAPHALHGGSRHWGRQQWAAEVLEGGAAVRFTRVSPDGEAGYPGQVAATVTYHLRSSDAGAALGVTMEAETSAACPISLVQHTYWNLAGHAKARGGSDSQCVRVMAHHSSRP